MLLRATSATSMSLCVHGVLLLLLLDLVCEVLLMAHISSQSSMYIVKYYMSLGSLAHVCLPGIVLCATYWGCTP